MPELPEVETVCRGAQPHLPGRRLRAFTATRGDLRWPMPVAALAALAGHRCVAVTRRSKYLLLDFAKGRARSAAGSAARSATGSADRSATQTAMVHLGMSGRLGIDVVSPRSPRPEWQRHEHWRMDFGDRLVRFTDPRRFGILDLAATDGLGTHKLFRDLGPEPLGDGFDGPYLFARSRKRRTATKVFLMDARNVVGVGNIYASEACWRAGVRPGRAAGRLTRAECDALATHVQAVLRDAIAAGGTTLRDYVGVDADTGYFQRDLAVYDRRGEPCPRCGTPIKRTVHTARSTYYCPGCQR